MNYKEARRNMKKEMQIFGTGSQEEKRNCFPWRERGKESGCVWKYSGTLTSKIHSAWDVIQDSSDTAKEEIKEVQVRHRQLF